MSESNTVNLLAVVLKKWQKAKEDLRHAQAAELELRELALSKLDIGKPSGSKTLSVGDFKVTVTKPMNYVVDEAEYRLHKDRLTSDELACFKWKPTVVAGAFSKQLDNLTLGKIITAKPGQGQLAIKVKTDG